VQQKYDELSGIKIGIGVCHVTEKIAESIIMIVNVIIIIIIIIIITITNTITTTIQVLTCCKRHVSFSEIVYTCDRTGLLGQIAKSGYSVQL
jgi:hypothetical protein